MVGIEYIHCYVKKLDDSNLSVLLDLYYSIFNTSEFSLQSRYNFLLLHTSSCILRGGFSGRLFPFEESVGCPLSYRNWNVHY